MTPPHLQVYPQQDAQGDVTLVGTPAGLMALIQAIGQHLFAIDVTTQTFYDARGTPYTVRIELVPDEATFARYLPPYPQEEEPTP